MLNVTFVIVYAEERAERGESGGEMWASESIKREQRIFIKICSNQMKLSRFLHARVCGCVCVIIKLQLKELDCNCCPGRKSEAERTL